MRAYDFTRATDFELRRDVPGSASEDRVTTATRLARLAEFDARGLYLGDGYPSMHAYCVRELHQSDEEAFLRIAVARAGRRLPALFDEFAQGRLTLTAIRLLAPHLTAENVAEVIAEAAGLRRFEIEQLVARRFAAPQRPKTPIIRAIPTAPLRVHGLNRVYELFNPPTDLSNTDMPPTPEAPPSEERFEVRFSTSRAAHDRLRYAQSLLSHAVPSGDLEQIYDRAIICLIAQHEKRKFAATEHPRPQGQKSRRKRDVPAEVKRVVWKRDQGRCTFVSATGHRCPARQLVEYDHADPVALGGKATVERIRLRCRAHNQYAAERVFGKDFMARKRRQAKERKTKNLPRS